MALHNFLNDLLCRRSDRLLAAGSEPGRGQPADGPRRLLRVRRQGEPADAQARVDEKREFGQGYSI